MSVKVQGIPQAVAAVDAAVTRFRHAFQAAVFVDATTIATTAADNAPKKSGELRSSVYVTRTMPVQIGFSARHAAITHETGPRKKYLQRASSAATARARARVALLTAELARTGTTLQTAPAKHSERPRASWPSSSSRKRPSVPARRRLP